MLHKPTLAFFCKIWRIFLQKKLCLHLSDVVRSPGADDDDDGGTQWSTPVISFIGGRFVGGIGCSTVFLGGRVPIACCTVPAALKGEREVTHF